MRNEHGSVWGAELRLSGNPPITVEPRWGWKLAYGGAAGWRSTAGTVVRERAGLEYVHDTDRCEQRADGYDDVKWDLPHGSAKSQRTLEWLHWSQARFLIHDDSKSAVGRGGLWNVLGRLVANPAGEIVKALSPWSELLMRMAVDVRGLCKNDMPCGMPTCPRLALSPTI